MSTSKRTTKAPTADAEPEIEQPVLYWTGRTPKAGLPERDLYAVDVERRSVDALIQTGAYTDVKPGADDTEAVTEPEPEAEEPEA